jgi:catechol 2,3-dioxygenase-like lactoylglutathione lyase family enzyme
MLERIAPFFIVDDLNATIDFYRSKLGCKILHKGGGETPDGDYFAIVGRDKVMLMIKAIAPEVHSQPNHKRHGYARWDAYVDTTDPATLYEEYVGSGTPIHRHLEENDSDGLMSFEITDNNGYVLCFGRPNESTGR